MTVDKDSPAGRLLAAIFQDTGGVTGRAASMWALGQTMGLDRAQTEDAAMDLVAQGLLEIKSLSGGMALTEEGALQAAGLAPSPAAQSPGLEELVKKAAALLEKDDLGLRAQALADLRLDLACLKAQMQRSQALPGVIKSLLEAVSQALAASPSPQAGPLLAIIKDFQ